MYGVPDASESRVLLDASIQDIKHWEHTFVIRLSNDRTIQVEGGYRVSGHTSSGSPAQLNDLVELTISDVATPSKTELVIRFSAGISLILFDDNPQYECVVIDPDGIII